MNAKRSRGQGQIRSRGSRLQLRFYRNGQRVEESTPFTDTPEGRKKAEKLLRKRLGEVAAGIYRDTRAVGYRDLRDAYLLDYRANEWKSLHRGKDGNVYLDAVKRLDAFFMGYRASEIHADSVRQFQAAQRSKGLANATINRSISAVRRMFNLARKEGRLLAVPFFPMLKEAPARSGFVERAEYERLFQALPDYLRPVLALGYWTGMRRAEILNLEWSQIDFLAGTIRLRAGETKNNEGRVIPITAPLRSVLVEQRNRRRPECPYVCFLIDRLGHARKLGNFRKVWQSRCVKLGLGKMEPAGEVVLRSDRPHAKPKPKLTYKGLVFHDLRRSCVRNLVRSQVPEKIAMAISGHKTRAVFDRYNIVSENDLVNAGRQLESYFGKNGDNSGTAMHQNAAASSPVN